MDQGKVCIEVALNGPWTRRLQPTIPLTPDEIVSDAIECAKAGASIIHFHAYVIEEWCQRLVVRHHQLHLLSNTLL